MTLVNKPILQQWEKLDNFSHYIAEVKFDGMRCLVKKQDDKLNLIREDGRIKSLQFPEVINKLEKLNLPNGTILDGEVCIPINEYLADFTAMSQRMNVTDNLKIRLRSKANPASFIAFDVLQYDNEYLENNPLIQRKKVLENIKIDQVKSYDVFELQKKVKEYEMEGMVLKSKQGSYHEKWYKLKNLDEGDFTVIGFNGLKNKNDSSGTRPITSLILANKTGKEVGSVCYQPNMDQTINPIGRTAIVLFQVMVDKSLKLRFPVLKELR